VWREWLEALEPRLINIRLRNKKHFAFLRLMFLMSTIDGTWQPCAAQLRLIIECHVYYVGPVTTPEAMEATA